MEKIVVLKSSSGDEKLVNCLRALFPECTIEVHERESGERIENFYAVDNQDDIYDERLEKYLSFL